MAEQVVIVTGGARGIGFGIGKCFALKGASAAIADLDSEASQKAADELNRLGAQNSIGVKCDVTHRDEVQALTDKVMQVFGRVDVLVNNAGVMPFIDIMEMVPEVWQRTIDVNLTGAFNCTQIVAREMIKRGKGGRIIFITSLAENISGPQQVDYGASKAGMRMTMVGFATALGPYGITCNAIAPGITLTPMTAPFFENPEVARHYEKRIPVGRVGKPEDIGHACIFLASPEASYISGITLRVDGGYQAVAV